MNDSTSPVQHVFSHLTYAGGYARGGPWRTVQEGVPDNGDCLEFGFQYHADTFLQLRFKAYGCCELYAAAETVCRHVQGLSVCELKRCSLSALLMPLQLPAVKRHIHCLVERLWRSLLSELDAYGE